MSNFAQIKKEAWAYYQTWMKEKTYCPALRREILVTLKGWDHLVKGTKTKRRNTKDKINRLSLLKDAKYLIKSASKYRIEERLHNSFVVLERHTGNKAKNQRIVVIISRDSKGNFIFHSVMKK